MKADIYLTPLKVSLNKQLRATQTVEIGAIHVLLLEFLYLKVFDQQRMFPHSAIIFR